MKGKLIWLLVFLVAYLITSIATQYLWSGHISPWIVFGVIVGIVAGFLITSAPRKPVTLLIGTVLAVLCVPVALVWLISLVLSLFSVKLTGWAVLGLYIIGVLKTIYLAIRFGREKVLQEPVIVDERNLAHSAWSGLWSFIILNFLIMGALLQPWVALDRVELWIGVLVAGLLFWLISVVILEMKR